MQLYGSGKTPSTSYEVQTFLELPTFDEAVELAQAWVAEVGGEALVFRRRTKPWFKIVRVARFGKRR